MEEEKDLKDEIYFEEIIKKTKTGVTFPKTIRDELFEEDQDVFFRMIIPQEKDKIILEILSEEQAKQVNEELKAKKPQEKPNLSRKKNK